MKLEIKLFLLFALFQANLVGATEIEILNLKVEGLPNPLGVETQSPRFSWSYNCSKDSKRGFKQYAYQIKVSSSQELISADSGDVWNSSIIVSDKCKDIAYAGSNLKSGMRYYWKVYLINDKGLVVASKSSFFEMGLLSNKDWGDAKWIGKQSEMPKSIAAKVEKWTDYDLECEVKIILNSANLLFRATYTTELCYVAQIEPGNSGKISVYKNIYGKKSLLSTIDARKPILKNKSYKIRISANKDKFNFYLDNVLLTDRPIEDNSLPNGTVGVGAIDISGTAATAIFDNFKVSNKKEILYFDNFKDNTLNNFQDILFPGGGISQPKEGHLFVHATNSLLEIKKGQEAPLLRKTFSLKSNIKRARAYVSGIGYYEMSINGNKVGNAMLEPGYSRYDNVIYYSVYDITSCLDKENIVGFELGRGWYGITTPSLWGEFRAKDWLGEPKIKAILKVEYNDGSVENIVTDELFKVANGPILFESLKAGEYYDARQEIAGWNCVGFNDSKWKNAVCSVNKFSDNNKKELSSQMFEPIREVETESAKLVKKIDDNTYFVDFGRHLAGNVELKVKGKRGTKIMMQYAERMEENGFPSMWRFAPTQTGCYQQDVYILSGKGNEKYQAKYSYKGFRYIIVTGFPGVPTVDNFTAKVINSDMKDVGFFESSSELLNKISNASKRSIQSNMHSIPTDCPTFEKLGWSCDDAAPLEAMAYYYDVTNLYEKRLRDYAHDMSPDGAISDVLPSTWGLKDSDPAWNGSYIAIVWKIYELYGNKNILSEHYSNLCKYINRLTVQSKNYIITYNEDKGYGDWCPPDHVGGRGPEGLSLYHTVYYYWYTTIMSKIAKEIGNKDDVSKYNELAQKIKDAINLRYFLPEENAYYFPNKIGGYRQTAQVLPLYFDIVPRDKAQHVADNLAKDVIKRNNHLWVGILGYEYIADVLMQYGYTDLAYEINLKDDFPSVGNMIREGATTLWESYSLATTRSLNHKMYSPVSEWLFKSVTGLGADEKAPGFQKAIIAPKPYSAKLSYAKSTYNSHYGLYESEWRYSKGIYMYNVTVPPNCIAKLRIPTFNNTHICIKEGLSIVWKENSFITGIEGIKSAKITDSYIEFEIGSGAYKFSAE